MTIRIAAAAIALMLSSTLPSLAEEPGRFALVPAGEGFLRLDTASGAVSLCSRRSIGWACEQLPDAAAAAASNGETSGKLSADTGALRDRLAKAEADLAAMKAANAELRSRAEAAEEAAKDAKAEADERVAAAEQHASQTDKPDVHGVEPHPMEPRAAEPIIPDKAVDEFSAFVTKLMRRLQDMARDLQRDDSERAL